MVLDSGHAISIGGGIAAEGLALQRPGAIPASRPTAATKNSLGATAAWVNSPGRSGWE